MKGGRMRRARRGGGIGSGSYRVTVTVSSDGRRTESAERRRVKGCSRRW